MKNLSELAHTVYSHQAVNNNFYCQWVSKKLTLNQISIFARNYLEWTYKFPGIIAALIMNTDDVVARTEYTKTLYSEMGNGEAKRAHSTLFEGFCNQLSKKFGQPDYMTVANLRKRCVLLSETNNLISWQRDVYQNHRSIAAGAHLALEWQAYTMIRKLYEGARNYMDLWAEEDAFHEACEFFYAHIGAVEKEHKEESIIAAAKLIDNGASFEDIHLGFTKNLNMIADFWNAIAKAIDMCS